MDREKFRVERVTFIVVTESFFQDGPFKWRKVSIFGSSVCSTFPGGFFLELLSLLLIFLIDEPFLESIVDILFVRKLALHPLVAQHLREGRSVRWIVLKHADYKVFQIF